MSDTEGSRFSKNHMVGFSSPTTLIMDQIAATSTELRGNWLPELSASQNDMVLTGGGVRINPSQRAYSDIDAKVLSTHILYTVFHI